MMKKQAQELSTQIEGIRHEVGLVRDEVVRKLERLDAWLVVHDPSTRHAAEAYEGLRKQLGAGAKSRRLHLLDLSKLDGLLRTLQDRLDNEPDTSGETILRSIREHLDERMQDAGLLVVDASPDTVAAFDGVPADAVGLDTELETTSPGYIDVAGDRPVPVRRGQARVVQADPHLGADAPEVDLVATDGVPATAADDPGRAADAEAGADAGNQEGDA